MVLAMSTVISARRKYCKIVFDSDIMFKQQSAVNIMYEECANRPR